jgi:predicted RNA-binding Zn-ribbon protein involved in translation (DUF1610 family)
MAAELHFQHCDAEDKNTGDHVCQGTITINASTCSFDCARCGHDRVNIRQQVQRITEQAAFEQLLIEECDRDVKARIAAEEAFNASHE